MDKEYSIIWKQFSKNSEIGKHLNISEDIALPYFIDGIDKRRFDKSKLDGLTEFHLLRGVLVGYFDDPPIVDTEKFKSVVKRILKDLKEHFETESVETLILNIASFLRTENGDEVSLNALLAGADICPDSSTIKYDCCADLFNRLIRGDLSDNEWGKKKLNDLIKQINTNEIKNEAAEYLEKIKKSSVIEDNKAKLIKDFESQIKSFEEHLFGVILYYDTTPKVLQWSQKSSFKKITGRMSSALSDARKLLRQVKESSKPPTHLQSFNWPSRWKPMEDRIDLLLKAYKLTFFDRPMTRLSKNELTQLRQAVKKMI